MATLTPELLELLADPETHEPLALADEAQLTRLRAAIQDGRARRRGGQPVAGEFDGALLSQGQRVAYLIAGGIANLLIDERLELGQAL
ncbi:MAG TPA: hypothetical protein VFX59_29745 [Polyangiales bacterium]|nr:hypothetical protein [Polyangiales bacterium]